MEGVVRGGVEGGKRLCALVARVVVTAEVEGLDCCLFADIAAVAHNDYNIINKIGANYALRKLLTKILKGIINILLYKHLSHYFILSLNSGFIFVLNSIIPALFFSDYHISLIRQLLL